MPSDNAGIAKPTIAEVLAKFLAEKGERLAPKTLSQYRNVIDLLQHCLDDLRRDRPFR